MLHTRPYRNTSLLVDFFTREQGLVRCVAKGQRSKKNASQLSLFCIYQIEFSGKSDLKSLVKLEPSHQRYLLHKQALFSGFYVNEVLMRVLYPYHAHQELFEHCCQIFKDLADLKQTETNLSDLEVILRHFEFTLLEDIGYLIDMRYDWQTGMPITDMKKYVLDIEKGLREMILSEDKHQYCFSGETISLLSEKNFSKLSRSGKQVKLEAKILSRLLLAPHLGEKPLQSKALFEKR